MNQEEKCERYQVWHSGKNNANFKHGMRKTPTYTIWTDMKRRCDVSKHQHFDKYGGRGITYCEKWKTFLGFFEDMGTRPNGAYLDRQDNDLGYSKSNCKWVLGGVSIFNKRSPIRDGLSRGVLRSGKKFRSTITIERKKYNLGSFETEKEASDVYLKMCIEWYGKLPPEQS